MSSARERPPLSTMLLRGARKHCPRCNAGHLFKSWFSMKERCPGCGYLFDRGTGFWLGAYTLNLVVAELALGVVIIVLIAQLAGGASVAWWPYVLAGVLTQIAVPAFFYPFSKTIWAAFDLMVVPLDAVDEAEAIVAVADRGVSPDGQ